MVHPHPPFCNSATWFAKSTRPHVSAEHNTDLIKAHDFISTLRSLKCLFENIGDALRSSRWMLCKSSRMLSAVDMCALYQLWDANYRSGFDVDGKCDSKSKLCICVLLDRCIERIIHDFILIHATFDLSTLSHKTTKRCLLAPSRDKFSAVESCLFWNFSQKDQSQVEAFTEMFFYPTRFP